MRNRLPLAVVLLFTCVPALAQQAVFEATVVRVEPWGAAKIACGIYANYRLAEYRIHAVYRGTAKTGQNIVVEHLACDYNELDGLKTGDKVIVVASVLPRPRTAQWAATRPNAQNGGGNVTVSHRAKEVAKIVYPTEQPERQ